MKEAVMETEPRMETRDEKGPRVLVVDDDAAARCVLGLLLTHVGYDIHEASDGFEALRRMETIRCEVIVTDYRMPNLNGLQLLRVVRARWPETPVIVLSDEPPETAWLVRQYGAYAWLPKPLDQNQLLRTLSEGAQQAAHPYAGPRAPRVTAGQTES